MTDNLIFQVKYNLHVSFNFFISKTRTANANRNIVKHIYAFAKHISFGIYNNESV